MIRAFFPFFPPHRERVQCLVGTPVLVNAGVTGHHHLIFIYLLFIYFLYTFHILFIFIIYV